VALSESLIDLLSALEQPLAKIVIVLGLARIKILHPLRMVFSTHRTQEQMIKDFQVVEKGHSLCGERRL
jgi:hypothetical protein